MTGAEKILAERQRQLSEEGWTEEHDDTHQRAQLNMAAHCYGDLAWRQEKGLETELNPPPIDWPWGKEWWKPSDDPVRNLEKAGALIAAEIDRIERKRKLHQDNEA